MPPQSDSRRNDPGRALRYLALALLCALFTTIATLVIATDVQAASTQSHVVMPGERLASIARQYCTTWQELYNLNRHILGPNPDYLPAGITITVIDNCSHGGGSGGSGGVYDRGPTVHARGTVSGNTYFVQLGDTIFSIANRFGVDQYTLMRANGIQNPQTLRAGSTLIIPGLDTPGQPGPGQQPFVTITEPTWGASLNPTFVVSGRGGRLFEGNVVVQAQDRFGGVLVERATTLQGSNVGAGGEGTYSVQLTVNVAANTPGRIVAFSPGAASAFSSVDVTYNRTSTNTFLAITEPFAGASLPSTFVARGTGRGLFEGNVVVTAFDQDGRILYEVATILQGNNVGTGGEGTWSAQLFVDRTTDGRITATSPGSPAFSSVSVRFNGQGGGQPPSGSMKDFRPGECVVRPRAGAPAYGHPQGPQVGTFAGGSEYDAIRGVFLSGIYWYYVDIAPGSESPFVWVTSSDLDGERGSCTW